jgi:hypothetical protein
MNKAAKVFLTLFLLFYMCRPGWAQLNQKQEERLKELELKEEAWKNWEESRSAQDEDIIEEAVKQNKTARKDSIDVIRDNLKNDKIGRYQAIRMDSNAIFIIDTKEGHLWVWVIQKDSQGIPSEFLFYQGKLVPGRNMGDLIDRTYKKFPEKKR